MGIKGNLFHSNDLQSVLQRISSVQPDANRQWGSMNSHQMLVHCSDVIREVLGIRTTPNLSNIFLRTVVKWIALYGPEWQKGKFPTAPDYDQLKKGTAPLSFDNDRNELMRLLTNLGNIPANHPLPAHPAFGKLDRTQWGRLSYRHIDHHLRQFGC